MAAPAVMAARPNTRAKLLAAPVTGSVVVDSITMVGGVLAGGGLLGACTTGGVTGLEGVDGVEGFDFLELFLWFHRARRDLLVIDPAHGGGPRGVFALRAPVRPNPIAVTTVALVARHGNRLIVRGLEALDGTPLIDIKPGRCPNAP